MWCFLRETSIYSLCRDYLLSTPYLQVHPTMTAEEVLKYVVTKAELDANKHWGIFEVICGRELQRPLHYSESVLDVTLCWGAWPDEYCRDNYLCVKENSIYEKVDLVVSGTPFVLSRFELNLKKKKSMFSPGRRDDMCFINRKCLNFMH